MARIDTYNLPSATFSWVTAGGVRVNTYGLGAASFIMRAKQSGAFIYWTSSGTPDFTGAVSGQTVSTLSDIVVVVKVGG